MHVNYEYGPRGDMPALKLNWYQGADKPELWTKGTIPKWTTACSSLVPRECSWPITVGTCSCPRRISAISSRPEPFIPKSIGHYAEWIHACKTGTPTTCNFEYAGWLTEANHLGNVAYRTGKKLEWDAAKLYAPNAPEAEPLIRRDIVRDGHLPRACHVLP